MIKATITYRVNPVMSAGTKPTRGDNKIMDAYIFPMGRA